MCFNVTSEGAPRTRLGRPAAQCNRRMTERSGKNVVDVVHSDPWRKNDACADTRRASFVRRDLAASFIVLSVLKRLLH